MLPTLDPSVSRRPVTSQDLPGVSVANLLVSYSVGVERVVWHTWWVLVLDELKCCKLKYPCRV